MSTALATLQSSAITSFGQSRDIAAIQKRIVTMIPGATEAPADVVWAAAQLAVAYRLDPFGGDLYIMKLGKKQDASGQWVDDYRAHIGIKGLRKNARRIANYTNDEPRMMSADEVKRYRGDMYDAGDVGVEFTLYRLDVAREAKQLGIPYHGVKSRGFWRVKAKLNKKENKWEPDPIPNTWTPADVAEKRAEINAIKKAYDLDFEVVDPVSSGDSVESETVKVLNYELDKVDRDNALITERREYVIEDDGDILFAADTTSNRTTVKVVGSKPEPTPDEVEDAKATDLLDDKSLPDPVYDFVSTLRSKEVPGARKATDQQYKYVVGILEAITGKDTHTALLKALMGRPVDSDSPLSEDAAKYIFKYLSKKSSVQKNGKWEKIDNPDCDEEKIEFVSWIWKKINAQPDPAGK